MPHVKCCGLKATLIAVMQVLQLKGLFVCFHGSMDLVSAFKPPYFSLEVQPPPICATLGRLDLRTSR
jgi:hypothetical protein